MIKKEFKQPENEQEAIKIGKELIKYSTARIQEMDEKWLGNINVMLALIDYRPDAYQYASVAIREDSMLARMVVQKSPKMFRYVAGDLNADLGLIKLVFSASRAHVSLFGYVDKDLMDNKSFVLGYISKYPMMLEYVSERLKDDDIIVKMATAKNSSALKYASMRFKNNREFVLDLMGADKTYKNEFGEECKDTTPLYVLQYASEELRSDKEIVNWVLKQDIYTYRCLSDKVRANKSLALKIVKREGVLLKNVDESLKNDKEVVITAVKNYGEALEFASDDLKADRDVVTVAIKKSGRSLIYASPELRQDIELINIAFKKRGPFIIEPVAMKVYDRLGVNYIISEKSQQNIKRSVAMQMHPFIQMDLQDIEQKHAEKVSSVKSLNEPKDIKDKKLEALELEKKREIERLRKEYATRIEREVKTKVYDKQVTKMEADPNYPKIAKYNSGKMTAQELLKFQNWLLKQARDSDFVQTDEFKGEVSDESGVSFD